jgi:hypothetical protein
VNSVGAYLYEQIHTSGGYNATNGWFAPANPNAADPDYMTSKSGSAMARCHSFVVLKMTLLTLRRIAGGGIGSRNALDFDRCRCDGSVARQSVVVKVSKAAFEDSPNGGSVSSSGRGGIGSQVLREEQNLHLKG